MATLLIVDDEPSIRQTLSMLLRAEGYVALEADGLEAAAAALERQPVDLVILDLRLGDANGMALLAQLKAAAHPAESIVMTAYASIETAVEAMRLGAYDYLTKPINPDELMLRINKVLEKKSLREEVKRLREKLSGRDHLSRIIAGSQAMQEIVALVERIGDLDIPVLVTGETGTGKEVVARAIHAASRRAQAPFIAVNCCALPEELLDSELFGHVKGAFTGATANMRGLFQRAHKGTLFLDEIGDISPRLQAKLLRVLQEGEVRPVGGEAEVKVDVRVIVATNRDLDAMVAAGGFRSDLLFRLNVLPIALPPLRERREDIALLVDHFLMQLRQRRGRDDFSLTAAARDKLLEYDWPGNVRQLENIMERSFALHAKAVLDADDIALGPPAGGSGAREDETRLSLTEMETRHIRRVLAAHGGNQVAAARVLGISRSTLRRKLDEAGLAPPG
ncbi:MAG: sigma-54 dependent transcriptional regulator [Betaproteobacteria bacterium]|nr:sigma-54 dependent transcriptional regulator [Betaproteobacteria bacterium]